MTEIRRFGANRRASRVVVSGDRIETSGIVAEQGVSRDIAEQTRSVLRQLEEMLREAGAGKKNLTRIQIWLSDMKDFDGMNRVYDEWIGDTDQPARACVGSQLADDSYRIEIQATGTL